MERRRTRTSVQERLREFAEIARNLIEGPLEQRLAAVIERAPLVLDCRSASIFLTRADFAGFAERLALPGVDLIDDAPRPQGITSQVLDSAQLLAVDNTTTHPEVHPSVAAAGIHSFMAVPLRSSAGCLGVMYVNYSEPRRFRGREKRLAAAIGDMVGQAVENARLLESQHEAREALEAERLHLSQLAAALDRSVAESDLLRAVATAAVEAESLDGLLTAVAELLQRSVPLTALAILVEEGRQLVVRAVAGEAGARTVGRRAERRPAYSAWRVIDVGEPELHDARRGSRAYGDGIRSTMQLPLRWKKRVYGVLDVTSTQQHAFDVPALNLMRKVADEIAGWAYLLLNPPAPPPAP